MKCRILTLIIAFIACLPMMTNVIWDEMPQYYTEISLKEGDIRWFKSLFRCQIGRNYRVSICEYGTNNTSKSLSIPDSIDISGIKFEVAFIDDNAFKNCDSLTEIKISSCIRRIHYGAFDSCRCLTKILVDSNNTKYTSINGILYNKDKTSLLRAPEGIEGNIVIPSSVTTIAEHAFRNCRRITNIVLPDELSVIRASAFEGCANLTSINFSNSITRIEESAFEGCVNLTDIKLPDNLKAIWNNAFSKSGITSITIPLNLTIISEGTFSECKNLRTITFHANIRTCSPTALLGCKNLISINVDPQNKYFSSQDGVLYNKDKTKLICFPGGYEGHFTIPSTVTCIGKNAFYKCQKLTDITIPKSVTTLEENAFRECTGLTKIKIPKNVVEFGTTAFLDCINADIEIDNPIYKVRQKKFVFNRCKSVKWKK